MLGAGMAPRFNPLQEAARGDNMTNLMIALRLVLKLEQIPCPTP
jgi:hypothetical protein